MFNFMKKDKEAKKEKEDKKREKKEKKEKEKKDKHRDQTTQEELNRLEEAKKGVFRRKSDRKKRDEASNFDDDDDGGFLPRDSDSSNSLASAGRMSPGREHASIVEPKKTAPPTLPKPKSILKSKTDVKANAHDLDDSMLLKSNTAYNEEISGVPVGQEKDKKQRSSRNIQSSSKNRPPEFQPPPPPESPPPEKSYKASLKLPDIIPAKPPRVRELVINRSKAGDFGFTLRKGIINKKGNSGEDIKQNVIFAEPGANQNSTQTGLIPGDRLIEVNGINVENTARDEVIDLIRKTGDTVVLKVQPIPELVELSVRPSVDGSLVDVEKEVIEGGTLKRSGSKRYKPPALLGESGTIKPMVQNIGAHSNCGRCGFAVHDWKDECPAITDERKGMTCMMCRKTGHFTLACNQMNYEQFWPEPDDDTVLVLEKLEEQTRIVSFLRNFKLVVESMKEKEKNNNRRSGRKVKK